MEGVQEEGYQDGEVPGGGGGVPGFLQRARKQKLIQG